MNRTHRLRGALLAAGLLLGLSGCAHTAPAVGEAEAAPMDFHAIVHVDDTVVVGDEATLELVIEPLSPYMIDPDFPVEIRLDGDAGLVPQHATMTSRDLATLKKGRLVADATLDATRPGAGRVRVSAHFGLCTETHCVPRDYEKTVTIRVRGQSPHSAP